MDTFIEAGEAYDSSHNVWVVDNKGGFSDKRVGLYVHDGTVRPVIVLPKSAI